MSEQKNSAVQRVLKSVVGPAIGTSIALLVGCSTSTPSNNSKPDKPIPVKQPDTTSSIPLPGVVEPSSQGAVVTPASTPATAPVSPEIPEPGKIMPPRIGAKIVPVGKVAPEKVGKVSPEKIPQDVGKVVPKPGIRKVGTEQFDPKVGFNMESNSDGFNQRGEERPTRATRHTTDASGGILRTGFVGGRKLT